MRPDEHKAKESRKYQMRKKQQGDSEAAEVAEARKKAAKARDRGVGIGAIMRRNGDFAEETEEEKEERKARQAKFSRRKLESNADRYIEETEQDMLERDAELGIDRETTDLVTMLEEKDEGSSSFFKFKEEQLFDTNQQDMTNQNIMQLNFGMFESALDNFDTSQLLNLSKEDDLVQNALHEHPIVLDKPIVPSFSKNAKGYVLFKSQQTPKPNVISEANGIYLRNDGSNHRVIPPKPAAAEVKKSSPPVVDDLDEILAMEPKQAAKVIKPSLPRPGSIAKKPAVVDNNKKENLDDEAWLDDLLG